jgi:hypothetical protein
MTLFGRKNKNRDGVAPPPTPLASRQPEASAPDNRRSDGAAPGWSNVNAIRAEWPSTSLDRSADLGSWQQGVRQFEGNDADYRVMMRCTSLLAPALAHTLYGPSILRHDDLQETVAMVLYASLAKPPDGRTFSDSSQRAARLALTVAREQGWMPWGAHDRIAQIINDRANSMLLTLAIAPEGKPWLGDLFAFFAVPPTLLAQQDALPKVWNSDAKAVDRMSDVMQKAEHGDQASERHKTGLALILAGRPEEALKAFSEAARLGSPDAMKDAGDVALELERESEANFWFESAAKATWARWHSGQANERLQFSGTSERPRLAPPMVSPH